MSVILEKISKSFGKQSVFRDLSLEVKEGEFHVILGPSGEGKTTLLSIIAGLIKPDKGKIWIGGKLVNGMPPQKRHIGFVFQDFALFPHLTVFENIAYGLKIKGIKNKKLKEKVEFYLKMIGLEDYKNKYPSELSGGQKQRVALARALAIEPKLLLLDEPLSHVDAWQREKLREELKRIQKETGITTIYVTHSQMEARILADRVSILHKGRIEQTESPEELFYKPKTDFVANFIGVTNILKGKIVRMHDKIAIFRLEDKALELIVKNYPIFQEKKEISLCLHPEKIILSNIPEKENHYLGKVKNIKFIGIFFKVTVDVKDLILEVIISKDKVLSLKEGDHVWVCFASDALHPLCGRCQRLPQHLRKCRNS